MLVQVKNGPIDFQPREPFHPLFGAMPHTPLMLELQITKEYLGRARTSYSSARCSTETLDGRYDARAAADRGRSGRRHADGHRLTGIAGVANVGRPRLVGLDLQPGQLVRVRPAGLGPVAFAGAAIAREWAAQTFSPDPRVVEPVVRMMMGFARGGGELHRRRSGSRT